MKNKPSLDEIFTGVPSSRLSLDEIFAQPVQSISDSRKGFGAITEPISNFIENQKKRGADLANAVNNTNSEPTAGQQTPGETAAQFLLHNVAGGLGQIPATVGNVAGKVTYDMSPAPVQNAVNSVQEKLIPVAQAYQRNQDAFDAANPRAGRNFQAVREMINLLPLGNSEVQAGTGAALNAVGSATKNITKDIPKVIAENLKSNPLPTYEGVKALSQQSFRKADELGGIFKPEVRNAFIDSIKPYLPTGDRLSGGKSTIETIYENALSQKDKPLTLSGYRDMDSELYDLAKKEIIPGTGKPSAEGRQILIIKDNLKKLVNNAPEQSVMGGKAGLEATKRAVADWDTSLKINDIEKIYKRASMTDNEATSIKAGFRNLANNPAKMASYTPKERMLIEAAAKSSLAANTLRTTLGSRLIGMAVGAAVGSTASPIGAAIGATVGAGSSELGRALATKIEKRQGNKVLEELGKRIQTKNKE